MSLYRLKSIIPLLYVNLKPRDNVSEKDFKTAMTASQFVVLKRLSVLLMETAMTSEASKMYMQYAELTQELIARKLNANSVSTVKSRIRYDGQKMQNYFGCDIVDKILSTENEIQLTDIDNTIIMLLKRFPRITVSTDKLLTVPLPKVPVVYSSSVSDDEFEVIKAGAIRVSQKSAELVISKLGDKGVGYIRFLLDKDPIETVDIKRRNELLKVLT